MVEQSNIFGAVVFWLYVVAALIFTFLTIESIIKLPQPATSQGRKHVAIFTVLAFISFSTLSYNMLHVLTDSYKAWFEYQLFPKPLSMSPLSIWNWSISSRLFRDFGEAIVQNDACFLWTQSALLATMSASFFMAAQGIVFLSFPDGRCIS